MQAVSGRVTVTPGVYAAQRSRTGGPGHAPGLARASSVRRVSRSARRLGAALGRAAVCGIGIPGRWGRRAPVPAWWTNTPPDSAVLFIRPRAGSCLSRISDAPGRRLRLRRDGPGSGAYRRTARPADHGLSRRHRSDVSRRPASDARTPGTQYRPRGLEPGCRRLPVRRSACSIRPRTPSVSPSPGSATPGGGDSSAWGSPRLTGRPDLSLRAAGRFRAAGARRTTPRRSWWRAGSRPGRRRSAARRSCACVSAGSGPRQILHVTLMEDDGTSWSRQCSGGQRLARAVAAAWGLHRGARRDAAAGISRGVELLGRAREGSRRSGGPASARPSGAAAALAAARASRPRRSRARTASRSK